MQTITINNTNYRGLPLEPYCDIEHNLYAYYIGEDGTVWSVKDKKFLNPIMTPSGYYRIRLKFKSYKLHFLMAYTYFEKFRQNPTMDVHHIDCNKLNNCLSNIMPVTKSTRQYTGGKYLRNKCHTSPT